MPATSHLQHSTNERRPTVLSQAILNWKAWKSYLPILNSRHETVWAVSNNAEQLQHRNRNDSARSLSSFSFAGLGDWIHWISCNLIFELLYIITRQPVSQVSSELSRQTFALASFTGKWKCRNLVRTCEERFASYGLDKQAWLTFVIMLLTSIPTWGIYIIMYSPLHLFLIIADYKAENGWSCSDHYSWCEWATFTWGRIQILSSLREAYRKRQSSRYALC